MQLLVSVRTADEARDALHGGADIVDAKEPLAGALGAVSLPVFVEIVGAVAPHRVVSAALGDLPDADEAEGQALAFASAGASIVKVGFAGIESMSGLGAVIASAGRGAAAGGAALVAVAYADAADAYALPPDTVLDVAASAGAHGVLLDTFRKDAPSLFERVTENWLTAWVRNAQARGLFAAVAGRLTVEDLPRVLSLGADIAGVRGAACDGGRDGRISEARVQRLKAALRGSTHRTAPTATQVAASARTGRRA
jgi:uncharacterized protein (UPF0264 family)